MIRCLIVDDERAAIEILKLHILKVPFLSLIGSTTNPIEGIQILNENQVDLVFLDIRMPDMTGIDFIKATQSKCRFILTTAFSEYAMDGFDLDVIDYLLKPIAFPRFMKAVQKAWDLFSSQRGAYVEDKHIYVKTGTKGKLLKVDFSEILFIESVKNYAMINRGHTNTTVLIGLKYLQDILPRPQFWRVHKSFIVSTEKITSIESNLIFLKGSDTCIPVGESFRQEFYNSIKHKLIE